MKGIQVYPNKGPGPLRRGDNHKNVKIGWGHLKIFFSRTTEPSLTRLGTNYPWEKEKGIQVCSNEGDCPSPRGDNSKRVKIHRNFLKIFFHRTTEPSLTRLGTNYPWEKGIQVCSNEGDSPSPRGDNSKRVKIHRNYLKIFFPRNSMPNSIKLGTNYP
jgi:hypothetical protein